LRSIPHDHSDAKCREILQNIIKAMKPGYSKLLIFEWILPDMGSPLYPALLDLNMLALLSGMERTETQVCLKLPSARRHFCEIEELMADFWFHCSGESFLVLLDWKL